jgi:hypothetical protein
LCISRGDTFAPTDAKCLFGDFISCTFLSSGRPKSLVLSLLFATQQGVARIINNAINNLHKI